MQGTIKTANILRKERASKMENVIDMGGDLLDDMFKTDESTVEKQCAGLAEHIATEDNALEAMDEELKSRKEKLDQAKEQLATLLIGAGLSSISLANGLSPKVKINRKFFKATGVDDDTLFTWLRKEKLDGIIKPTVNFNTMQSTLREFEGLGNALPEIFNIVVQRTVTLYGKSKYLAGKDGK